MADSNAQLIILSGEAGAGKDAVADLLVISHDYEKFSLSHEMKVFCQRVFGWSDEQLWGASHFRNAPDPQWARPCKYCKGTGHQARHDDYDHRDIFEEVCEACEGHGTINDNSPRRVLQLLGDEWARQMIHPDIWTMSARPRLQGLLDAGCRVVINDARFANDRRNLHEWLGGARVDIRTERNKDANDLPDWRLHASERSRPQDDQVEYIIQNDEGWPFPALPGKIDEMLRALKAT